jgi:NAD(P)-dependent dehydrogenase (short-subunit alcohol dehydrogenase family)
MTASRILITGCSSGFGDLVARTLAADGHHVFATLRETQSRNAPAAQRLRDWAERHAARLDVLDLDVSSDASVGRAIGEVVRRAQGLDVLINNAGVATSGPLEAFSMLQVETVFGLNVFGALRTSDAVLPLMRAQRGGLIVFVSSTLGRVLPHSGSLYAATKWALEGLAESLAYQVARFGVDVAIVEPGSFPTPAMRKAIRAERADIAAAYADTPAGQAARVPPADGAGAAMPDPQEVAEAIKTLVDLPPGQRPLRSVVGPVFTDGVAAYNAGYERARDHLAAVLRRPDQAITWAPRPGRS